jgi:hypothetical protein
MVVRGDRESTCVSTNPMKRAGFGVDLLDQPFGRHGPVAFRCLWERERSRAQETAKRAWVRREQRHRGLADVGQLDRELGAVGFTTSKDKLRSPSCRGQIVPPSTSASSFGGRRGRARFRTGDTLHGPPRMALLPKRRASPGVPYRARASPSCCEKRANARECRRERRLRRREAETQMPLAGRTERRARCQRNTRVAQQRPRERR